MDQELELKQLTKKAFAANISIPKIQQVYQAAKDGYHIFLIQLLKSFSPEIRSLVLNIVSHLLFNMLLIIA